MWPNHTHFVMWPNHTHSVTSMLSESLCLRMDRSAACYTFRDMVVCVPRVSVCELEADGLAADILNRHELSMGKATGNLTKQCHPCRNLRLGFQYVNSTATPLPFFSFSPPSPSLPLSFSFFIASGGYPGLAAIWEEEKQRRLLLDNNASLSPPPSPGILPNHMQVHIVELKNGLCLVSWAINQRSNWDDKITLPCDNYGTNFCIVAWKWLKLFLVCAFPASCRCPCTGQMITLIWLPD